jgi:hypothetical protein
MFKQDWDAGISSSFSSLQVGLQRQRKKKKKLCMAEMVLFWTEIDHFSIWSLQFLDFAFKPLIFSISNFNPFIIKLKKEKRVQIWVTTRLEVRKEGCRSGVGRGQ